MAFPLVVAMCEDIPAELAEGWMTLREKLTGRRAAPGPTPAFMKIEGRLARPLPAEVSGRSKRNYWTVAPWIIVALVIAILLALMIPGLLMELRRAF